MPPPGSTEMESMDAMDSWNASTDLVQDQDQDQDHITDSHRWLAMNCSSAQEFDAEAFDTTGIRNAVMIVYTAGFFFGLAGNSLVIGIISYYKNIRIKSVANYYIWNLSLADLLFVLVLPFYVYNTRTQQWPFGDVACKVVSAFKETNHFSSVFLLVALSWDRYIASFYNLSHLRTIKLGTMICVIIWVICATISTPHWLYAEAIVSPRNETMCQFVMPRSKLWKLFKLVFGLLLPFIMITLAYFLLSARLKKMTSGCATSGVKKPSRKMTQTVAVVVTTFLVCQTPTYAIDTWSVIQELLTDKNKCPVVSRVQFHFFMYSNSIAEILVFISSCINPIIYGVMNENYRELYRVVLCRCQSRSPAASKAATVPVQERAAGTGAGSGSESESQGAAVAEVTYRFQVNFHNPCTGKKRKKQQQQQQEQHEQLNSKPATEHIMLDEVPSPSKL